MIKCINSISTTPLRYYQRWCMYSYSLCACPCCCCYRCCHRLHRHCFSWMLCTLWFYLSFSLLRRQCWYHLTKKVWIPLPPRGLCFSSSYLLYPPRQSHHRWTGRCQSTHSAAENDDNDNEGAVIRTPPWDSTASRSSNLIYVPMTYYYYY